LQRTCRLNWTTPTIALLSWKWGLKTSGAFHPFGTHSKLKKTRSQLVAAEAKLLTKQAEVDQINLAKTDWQNRFERQRVATSNAHADHSDAERRLGSVQGNLDAAELSATRLRIKLDKVESEHARLIEELATSKERLQHAAATIETLTAEIASATQRIDELEVILDDVRQQRSGLEVTVAEVGVKLDAAVAVANDLQSKQVQHEESKAVLKVNTTAHTER
jgi:chromosome segregation ATPase